MEGTKGMKKYGDYRDYLRGKGLNPVVIERTAKKAGDHVIVSSCKPVQIVGDA
jgi:hypothetical protein